MDLKTFMNFHPNKDQWQNEINCGWRGPDGSSCSTDHVFGVEIGRTSQDYAYRNLPANLHDWRYHIGRKHELGRKHRKAADIAYRKDVVKAVKAKISSKPIRVATSWRSWARYIVLRIFGGLAFKKDPFDK
jgi:hypothetical protein